MITEWEIIVRLILAAGLGAFIGYEREMHSQPAGLRTHVILVVGACLAMTISINLAMQFYPQVPNGDPARLAAQVVSGIGFLGAGAILRYGPNVKGLTTATSLWTMAIVGLAVGAGHYLPAVAATALLLFALVLLNAFEKRYMRGIKIVNILISAEDRSGLEKDINKVLSDHATRIESVSFEKHLKNRRFKIEVVVRLTEKDSMDGLMDGLAQIKGVRAFKVY